MGEYWIVDPLSQQIAAYRLTGDQQYERIDPVQECTSSRLLPGFYLRTEWLWHDELPNVLDLPREMRVS